MTYATSINHSRASTLNIYSYCRFCILSIINVRKMITVKMNEKTLNKIWRAQIKIRSVKTNASGSVSCVTRVCTVGKIQSWHTAHSIRSSFRKNGVLHLHGLNIRQGRNQRELGDKKSEKRRAFLNYTTLKPGRRTHCETPKCENDWCFSVLLLLGLTIFSRDPDESSKMWQWFISYRNILMDRCPLSGVCLIYKTFRKMDILLSSGVGEKRWET
jgi:hypothetical protein